MLQLYNTLTRVKIPFLPQDPARIGMYVCGPTVYDRPHLGNARSVVVYDLLYRVLTLLYGSEHVVYVRNITDVDDKINAAAKAAGEPISALTRRVEHWFHEDMEALHCLSPTHEPRATGHIPQMIAMIERLMAHGHAYVSQGHVLFAVASDPNYGQLSGRRLDELVAGARVEVESYKHHPGDFVLWKPADPEDDVSSMFESPWGKGRPGWHIECSAMSNHYLGATFDLHGGGADLMFPHHENEIAQSCCATPSSAFARHWVHNGFLTVNGEKMSKSLGNFITVKDLRDQGVPGEVIRLAFLMTKYNEPLNWNAKLLDDARKTLDGWYRALAPHALEAAAVPLPKAFQAALCDDLNSPLAIRELHLAAGQAHKDPQDRAAAEHLLVMGRMLGLLHDSPEHWFKGAEAGGDTAEIEAHIEARIQAKKAKNWSEADRIRKELADRGILLEDRPDGRTDWRRA